MIQMPQYHSRRDQKHTIQSQKLQKLIQIILRHTLYANLAAYNELGVARFMQKVACLPYLQYSEITFLSFMHKTEQTYKELNKNALFPAPI
jgi:hypothetical protein